MSLHNQSYLGLASQSWRKVMQMNERKWQAPSSVHLPLHPPHAQTFVYMDCAGNAYTLPVLPGIQTRMEGREELLASIETMIVQFAFGTPAFVPDFRLAQIELAEDRFALPKWSYYAGGLLYEIEYCCSRIDAHQNALWLNVAVMNDTVQSRDAHVRLKVNFQKEQALFDYHYVPFYWDATKWRSDHSVSLSGGTTLNRNGRFLGQVKSNDFDLAWEDAVSFTDEDYVVPPCMRLKDAQDLLHFSGALAQGERKEFVLALLTEHSEITSQHQAALNFVSMPEARDGMLAEFKSITAFKKHPQLILPQDRMDQVFTALQICNLQMLIDFKNGAALQPCQGGSSERFYVWVWEAMCMLLPMLQLGYFEPVRRAIDFIFTLQDGGTPPEGNYSTLAGAIGTTGPRWANSTGSALALATEYYRYSQDGKFLATYLDKMLRAAFWIIGEIRATRKLNPDGSRPPVYGLLPFACATDLDSGYIVAFSDAYSYYGLEKFSQLLQKIGHPQSTEVADEVAHYKHDLDQAVDYMSREDGFIDRKIVLPDDQSNIARGFDNIAGAQTLVFTGVLDAQDERFRRHADYCEKNTMRGFFGGAMNLDVMYIGLAEQVWQYAYLCLGDWKKAYASLQTNLKYGMSKDACLVQERFSLTNSAFTPWQPNSSGNGRMLGMMINQFYFNYRDVKHGDTLVFFGGMPPSWFETNPEMSLKGLYAYAGRISVSTVGFAFNITCDGFSLKNKTIRIPDYFVVTFDQAGQEDLGDGFFKVTQDVKSLSGRLREGVGS